MANSRFGVLVESLGATPSTTAQIVVERATYTNDAAGTVWGAGSNSLATRIRVRAEPLSPNPSPRRGA